MSTKNKTEIREFPFNQKAMWKRCPVTVGYLHGLNALKLF